MTNLEYYFGNEDRIIDTLSVKMGKIDREIAYCILETYPNVPGTKWMEWRAQAIRLFLNKEHEDE